jgi:hypothetical protein
MDWSAVLLPTASDAGRRLCCLTLCFLVAAAEKVIARAISAMRKSWRVARRDALKAQAPSKARPDVTARP